MINEIQMHEQHQRKTHLLEEKQSSNKTIFPPIACSNILQLKVMDTNNVYMYYIVMAQQHIASALFSNL